MTETREGKPTAEPRVITLHNGTKALYWPPVSTQTNTGRWTTTPSRLVLLPDEVSR